MENDFLNSKQAALGTQEPPLPEAAYWVWLTEVLGYGSERSGEVMAVYGSARAVYEARENEDLSPWMSAAALERLHRLKPEQFRPMLEYCAFHEIRLLTPDLPEYPAALLSIPDLPLVLYCTGLPQCLNGGHYVGVVGSRRPTQYGVQACAAICGELAENGAVIVSGLADGLDGEGHRAAVAAGTPTIGILGCPIDITYPAGNRNLRTRMEQNGAVLSEYPPGCPSGQKFMFLQRNRIIAALSDVLCVMEARTKSGTCNTVGHALRYQKPVLALPGSIFSPLSEGTNVLLADGRAKPLLSADVVLGAIGLAAGGGKTKTEKPAVRFADAAKTLLGLIGPKPKGIESLCEESGLGVGEVLAALTELELAGAVTALAGRRYIQR